MGDGVAAVVFDMDGLMIDSEPIWHLVEKEVFGQLGVELTDANCLETTGLRVDEMVAHRHKVQAWTTGHSQEQVAKMVIDGMVCKVIADPKPMAGLAECLAFFESKGVPLAVASSSPLELIEAALTGLGVRDKFGVVCSASAETFGKPHPAVYLTAASKLGVAPTACLALEDSMNGALSAKSARMKCIAVPDLRHVADVSRFSFCDAVLGSLAEVDEALWARLGGRQA